MGPSALNSLREWLAVFRPTLLINNTLGREQRWSRVAPRLRELVMLFLPSVSTLNPMCPSDTASFREECSQSLPTGQCGSAGQGVSERARAESHLSLPAKGLPLPKLDGCSYQVGAEETKLPHHTRPRLHLTARAANPASGLGAEPGQAALRLACAESHGPPTGIFGPGCTNGLARPLDGAPHHYKTLLGPKRPWLRAPQSPG